MTRQRARVNFNIPGMSLRDSTSPPSAMIGPSRPSSSAPSKPTYPSRSGLDLSRCISRAAQCLADTHNINLYITETMEAGGG